MQRPLFDIFFTGLARRHLVRAVRDSLLEDGPDLTSNAVFGPDDVLHAAIVAKEECLVAGAPIIAVVLEETSAVEAGDWTFACHAADGDRVAEGALVAEISGSARVILRAERVILNFLCHLSGIASLTDRYARILEGTGIRLLDTRKTLPCLRYPEKYAVLVGGGNNHRKNLGEMLMLKDNHIDASGGIEKGVDMLRAAYSPCPPIEVECRDLADVRAALLAGVERIMLDNMNGPAMREALSLIPAEVEVEISGGVALEGLAGLVRDLCDGVRRPDFISVGRLTHSAPFADFSMRIWKEPS